ncbi:DUF3473 domain-containing protein [Fimbriiglobus ruber]|uniref:Polysaccharide deacetylase n=1 Tax=Fimbriiglobus ruber TaxID=1908690 RepID=A0A225DNR3_9BACT|nr:DUF3473 domain-containing protein [Fimbriiglobus ruber]OWK42951.1 Polysaccharide deacetylase [Fimbriiglobus ruber]
MNDHAQPHRHILTIGLEDYFQVGAFNRFVQNNQWYRFEARLAQNTDRTLALLDAAGARATFFVLGWVAQEFPDVVRKVAAAGHEVGIKGYYHRGVRGLTPDEFRADCLRAKDAVETACGRRVIGYRLADGWLGPRDLWALDVLADLGFEYDSSIAPIGGSFANEPYRRFPHEHMGEHRSLWEIPISTARLLGVRVPVAGGNYFRQLPAWVSRRAAAKWDQKYSAPLVAYFHVWELDPEQPRLAVGSFLTRIRHYRNLKQMQGRIAALLVAHRFTSVAGYLGLEQALEPVPERASTDLARTPTPASDRTTPTVPALVDGQIPSAQPRGTPVTVVVPCFDEEEIVTYTARTLRRVRQVLGEGGYAARFVLVDDGSTDQTWNGLWAAFENDPGFDLVRHDVNLGVAAAIMTGLKRAGTEIVCSMDCDCTYDPLELLNMIPLLTPGVDLVTASPYHPAGKVRNVPGWRLLLSRGAAWLYRRVLRQKLYTYTSCFRVYRRSSVAGFQMTHGRYLGVAEMVGRLDLAGGKIVEHPATLEVRMIGRSKMKTFRTVIGHLGLLAKMAAARAFGWWGKAPRDQVIKSVIDAHQAGNAVLIRSHKTTPPPFDPDDPDVRRLILTSPPTPSATE